MRGPLQFDGREIERWADNPAAAYELPRLIRRLILATTKLRALDMLDMGAGSASSLGGWDGLCDAREGSAYCPLGRSGWEFSVQKDKLKKKLDDDFDKRSREPAPLDAGDSYVAVTARRYANKQQWVRSQSRRGHWAQVRLLDADDLAQWLESCPAVAAWFASTQLDRPTESLVTVEHALQRWSRATTPPLPAEIVLAGRDAELASLADWLERGHEEPLYVRGPRREEAAVFAAVGISQLNPIDSDITTRTLVVDTASTWRWLVQHVTERPLILIPSFAEFELELGRGIHRVIVPLDPSGSSLSRQILSIEEPQPWRAFARVLRETLRLSEREAVERAEQSGGRLHDLRRALDLVESQPPAWTQRPEDEDVLLALLLVGAWQPSHAGDRDAIVSLGVEAERVERVCQRLLHTRDTPIVLRQGAYEWGSAASAWRLLGARLSASNLQRFEAVAIQVLGEDDPRYELPVEQRAMAQVLGKAPKHSEALRHGVARALLYWVQSAVSTERQREVTAWRVIHAILLPHWQRWASFREELRWLAEASPSAFLEAVEASLDEPGGITQLFREIDTIQHANPHVGLVWSLEVLAWLPEHMPRVASVLVRLAEIERACVDAAGVGPRRISPSPFGSLTAMFHLIAPQTRTSDEERRRVLDAHAVRWGEVGFELMIDLLEGLTGMLPQARQPVEAHEIPPNPKRLERSIILKRARDTFERMLACAGSDASRWARVVRLRFNRHWFTEDDVRRAFDRILEVPDPDGTLWSAIRDELSRLFLLKAHEKHENRTRQLENLYTQLTPRDPILRYAWLFEDSPKWPFGPRPTTFSEYFDLLDRKRDQALDLLFADSDHLAVIRTLLERLPTQLQLGRALARSPVAAHYAELLLDNLPPLDLHALAVPFARGRVEASGWDKSVIDQMLRNWVQAGRHEEAARLARGVPPTPELWDLLDDLGDPTRELYWTTIEVIGKQDAPANERAIERMLACGNAFAALQVAAYSRTPLTTRTLICVLQAVARAHDNTHSIYDEIHEVFSVFDRRLEHGELDESTWMEIAALELRFIGAFEKGSDRQPRFVAMLLEHSPRLFVDLVRHLYKRDEGPPETDASDEAKTAAHNAYIILDAWQTFPGHGLDDPLAWEPVLAQWCDDVIQLARAEGWLLGTTLALAEVLARPPAGEDGHWPCVTARRLIEGNVLPRLANQLGVAKHNMRGVWIAGPYEGGAQERELADAFRHSADALRPEWPHTAAMLMSLADDYDRQADEQDQRARDERIRDGVELGSPIVERDTNPMHETPKPITRLAKLEIKQVGPFQDLDLTFAERVNVLVGDNSLGKTFVLDMAWWVLTGTWAGEGALPTQEQRERSPAIRHVDEHDRLSTSSPDRVNNEWARYVLEPTPSGEPQRQGWPIADALVLYARVDGSFTAWDRVRNTPDTIDVYRFSAFQAWNGLGRPDNPSDLLCRGLIADWRDWALDEDNPRLFQALCDVMNRLAEPDVPFEPAGYAKLQRASSLRIPLLALPYGKVPIIHMSAAWKRILTLAYLLVWTYHEHRDEAARQGVTPSPRIVLLIDEVETHLHPRWQRVILPALLAAVKALGDIELQLVVTTHSPMVMTSIEVEFDPQRDQVFSFELEGTTVDVEEFAWAKFGDASAWMRSLFGLSAMSPDAEAAIEAATALIHGERDEDIDAIDEALQRSLAASHPFWVRWVIFRDARKAGRP